MYNLTCEASHITSLPHNTSADDVSCSRFNLPSMTWPICDKPFKLILQKVLSVRFVAAQLKQD